MTPAEKVARATALFAQVQAHDTGGNSILGAQRFRETSDQYDARMKHEAAQRAAQKRARLEEADRLMAEATTGNGP